MVDLAYSPFPQEASDDASPERHQLIDRVATAITVVIADGNKTSRTVCLGTLQPEKGISVDGVAEGV